MYPLLFMNSLPIQVTTEQSSLDNRVGFHQLSILYIVVYIYMSIPVSQFIPSLLIPLVTIYLFSASVILFLLCKQVYLYHFFQMPHISDIPKTVQKQKILCKLVEIIRYLTKGLVSFNYLNSSQNSYQISASLFDSRSSLIKCFLGKPCPTTKIRTRLWLN